MICSDNNVLIGLERRVVRGLGGTVNKDERKEMKRIKREDEEEKTRTFSSLSNNKRKKNEEEESCYDG